MVEKKWWEKRECVGRKKESVDRRRKKVLSGESESGSPAAVESDVAACTPLVRRAPTLVRIIFILKSLADNEDEDGAVDLSADELLNVLPSVHLVSQLTLHHVAHP